MYACKNCNTNLRFDIESQMLLCPACGTKEVPEDMEKGFDAVAQEYMDVQTYHCSQCAGELIAEESEGAVFCPYCGSSTIVSENFKEIQRPKFIIPFEVTKEDCKTKYVKMMKKAIFAPKEMRNRKAIDSFRGIYMPYWYYSFDIDGVAYHLKTQTVEKDSHKYMVQTAVEIPYEGYAKGFYQDASGSFRDEISNQIKPFDTSHKKDFSPAYMSGFYADCPDTDSETYIGTLEDFVGKVIYGKLINSEQLKPYLETNIEYGVKASIKRKPVDVAMLPVWFFSYKKGNRIAYATVNGQTGKMISDVPVDYKKFFISTLIIFVILFILLNVFCVIRPIVLILIAAFLAVLVSLIFRIQIEKVFKHESQFEDAGVISARELKENKGVQRTVKTHEEQKEEEILAAFHEYTQNSHIRKFTTILDIVLGIILIIRTYYFFMVDDILSAFISLSMIALLIGGGVFLSSSVKFAKHLRKVYGHIVLYIALMIAVIIHSINPVNDIYYYISAFISLAASVGGLLDLVRQYNLLTTHPLPQFKRTGGDDNA